MAEVIGIISIKGGVGKTTTALNLSSIMANEFGKRTLIIDMNFSAPNLALHIGIVRPKRSIQDFLKGKCTLADTIINTDYGMDMIAGDISKDVFDYSKIKREINKLKKRYDMIIIDSSPNLNEEMITALKCSDKILVVSSTDYPTLSCTMKAIRIAKKSGIDIAGMIINKALGKNFETSTDDIEKMTGVPILATIKHEVSFLESLSHSMPLNEFRSRSEALFEMRKLAGCLVGERYDGGNLFNRILSKLSKNYSKEEINRELYLFNKNKA